MNYIQSVSIPRSGHHLLVNCLKDYFTEFRYCSFYDCCRTVPCPQGCDYQKNHDLGKQDTRNLPELENKGKSIIQYRSTAQGTFNSLFRNTYLKGLLGKDQNWWWNRPDDYTKYFEGEGSFGSYEKCIEDWRAYYERFVQKWLVENKNPESYFLEYYDFIERPGEHLTEIVRFFGVEPDAGQIARVVENQQISLKHDLQSDPLYRENFNELFGLSDPPQKSGFNI